MSHDDFQGAIPMGIPPMGILTGEYPRDPPFVFPVGNSMFQFPMGIPQAPDLSETGVVNSLLKTLVENDNGGGELGG